MSLFVFASYDTKAGKRNRQPQVVEIGKSEGFMYLGVDFESYNPTANRFWAKYFMEYINSVTRRIELWCKEYNRSSL